jgi:NADH-quinone oxidoreductase subunit G
VADYAPVDLLAAEQITFELNGRQVTAPAGTMLVDAAYAHGVEVPVFCYEPRLGPAIGACRMCLVEVEGMRGLQTACSTPVQPDMVVRTNSPAAKDAQDGVLELLLVNHPLDCPVCDKGGECPLQDRTFRFGPGKTRFIENKRHFPKPLNLSSLVALDRERCIACYRCVRFSQDVAEDKNLIMEDRGAGSEIATFTGEAYTGRFTGNVIDLCPVGALTGIPYRFVSRPWELENAPTVCTHCPVGCNTELTSRDGAIKRVSGRPLPNYAVEEGWLCDRGRWAYDADRSADRITQPVIRDATDAREVALEEAVDAAALLLGRGTGAGVLVGAGASVEEGFLARELAGRALRDARAARLGIPESPELAALRSRPGAQLSDLDGADLVAIVGGDPAQAQPVSELRVRKARRLGATIWSAGPRPHALEPLGPSIRTAPGDLSEAIRELHAPLRAARRPVVLWDEADLAADPAAAAALALALEGAPAALQLELAADVNGAGLRAIGLPAAAEGFLDAARAGEIGTLLAVHADPLTEAGAAAWDAALPRMGHLIVIASHRSPLTEAANVVLPAATGYEQEGVYVSMAKRAQRARPGSLGPAESAPAWEILIALAHRLGAPPAHRTPAQAFAAAAAASPALAGLTYDALGVFGAPIPGRPSAPAPRGDREAPEPAGDGLPLVLGRTLFADAPSHRSAALAAVRAEAALTLAPAEATRLKLAQGGTALLRSPHGECALPVRVDDAYPEGAAFATLGAPGAGVERLLPADRSPVRVTVARA